MSTDIVFLAYEAPEGGFTARAVNHPIFIQGDSEEALESNASDAIRCYFEESARPAQVELRFENADTRPA